VIRRLAVAIALVGIAVGCGEQSASADQPRTKVFELADYPLDREGWIGTGSSIREIDPDTLQPLTRRGLRLGGNSEGLVFSPNRSEAAFGIDFGELVFVDLPKMELRGRLRLGSPDWLVRPIGWPRPDLLYALGCTYAGKYGCIDNRLLLIDPRVPRQVASLDLAGWADVRYDVPSRTSVIFVSPDRVQPAHLLIAEANGAIHEVKLDRILVGSDGRRFWPHARSAAFVLEPGRAIVIGSRGVVAEIELRSRRVRYHRVPALSISRVSLRRVPSEAWTGTMNPSSHEDIRAVRAWPRRYLVTASRSKLGNRGESVRRSARTLLLDASTWSTEQWRHGYTEHAAGLLFVARSAKAYRGPTTILAYERPGAIRYRLHFERPVTYSTYGDRLYVGRINGLKTTIFDVGTGRLLHRVKPTDVHPAFSWTPPE
jgi:hypothetical protein